MYANGDILDGAQSQACYSAGRLGAQVYLAFQTKALRETCERAEVAEGQFSAAVAMAMRRRIADVEAAQSVLDLPVGNPRLEGPEQSPRLVVDLAEGARLVFVDNHPGRSTAGIHLADWRDVTRLKLIAIEGAA